MRVRAPLLLCSLLVAVACSPSAPPTSHPMAEDGAATVLEVVDGDTIEVEVGGSTEVVRLLGIDTPETVHPTKPVECFGPEASARADELLPPGTTVRLERDQEARDHFGRLLAYVHRRDDDAFVNEVLVLEGFAEVLIIEPNHAHASRLLAAQAAARGAGLGRWGACPG